MRACVCDGVSLAVAEVGHRPLLLPWSPIYDNLIISYDNAAVGWLGSRVISVLDSGAEGPRVQIAAATLSGNSLRQTVHTHCASVHQAAKLVSALLRVGRVTAGQAESNGSLPPGL